MSTSSGSHSIRSAAQRFETDSSGEQRKGAEALQKISTHLNESVRQLGQSMAQGMGQSPSQQRGTAGGRRPANAGAKGPASNAGQYSALDKYSIQIDVADLKQWSDFSASDQGVALERPIAAMQILAGKPDSSGQKPTVEQTDAAWQFVQENPSLRTALQNTGALKPDGGIDRGRLNDFLQQAEGNLALADKNIREYQKKNPKASRNALNAVRSAALLQAYEPIAGESAGHESNGKDNSYAGGKNGGGITTEQQIDQLQNNKGFSGALKEAAQAYATKGAFDAIDRSGDDKATTKAGNALKANNLTHFITQDAPSTQSSADDFLLQASLKNITGDTDTSKLDQDIFSNPQNYTPQQKAAVMVTLMKTLVNVQAGGSDDLRNVDATVAVLQKNIQTLASDPATESYLQKAVPPAMQKLGDMFSLAGGVSHSGGMGGPGGDEDSREDSGTSGAQSQSPGQNIVDQVHDALDNAKDVTEKLNKLAKGEVSGSVGEAEGVAEGAAEGVAEGAAEGVAEGAAEGVAAGAEAAAGVGAEAVAGVGAEAAAAIGGEAAVAVGAEAAAAVGTEAAVAVGAEAAVAVGAEVAAGAGVLAAAAPVLAVAAPVIAVGAAVAGVAAAVFGIVKAIQKAHHQQEFADNVNPTLKQFGIPLPK